MTHAKDIDTLKADVWKQFEIAIENTSAINLGRFAGNVIDYLHQRGLLAVEGVVVPREPTDKIIQAMAYQAASGPFDGPREKIRRIYKAMISAAQGGEK